ncbi:hypothetical protein NEIMUCOT_05621 [Neisseria mucosa ATCC 25996]|uniref:Uncharacterized protein n=1 Tax=Neisseria mucosa (strain ATCC 25996 / DSM 4631 / NCTC 10774 / M26) TaxID=546266 RepID=D2ZYB5_NEIM2|nr:hypothetical protein NEIMUCOT_05621 [Neisseria mucosa ATCC 25996]
MIYCLFIKKEKQIIGRSSERSNQANLNALYDRRTFIFHRLNTICICKKA